MLRGVCLSPPAASYCHLPNMHGVEGQRPTTSPWFGTSVRFVFYGAEIIIQSHAPFFINRKTPMLCRNKQKRNRRHLLLKNRYVVKCGRRTYSVRGTSSLPPRLVAPSFTSLPRQPCRV